MSRLIRHPIKELRFVGGRFEQNKGWLDFDVLPELQAYQRILIETAKEEWKRRNPGFERLRRGFEKNIRLGFHEVREGSCAVPVERVIELEDDTLFEPEYIEDEVDEAARIIDATLIAVREDAPFPDRLPARVIPMFEEWGKTLAPNEGIVLDGQNGNGPRFDAAIREQILNTKRDRYEDMVDLVGEVRAAELKAREGGSFTILLENGDSVPGVFTDEQETRITEALHEHRHVRLRILGLGEFEASGQLRRILRVDHLEVRPTGETPFDPDAPPIWEVLEQLGQSVPEEEWDKVPKDAAKNLDFYLYGSPREES
jgi:hypothetical protein